MDVLNCEAELKMGIEKKCISTEDKLTPLTFMPEEVKL